MRKLKIALLYGRFCSGGPLAFDVATLYESKGLTGSESMFFNSARGLAERGHVVQVFCDAVEESGWTEKLGGAQVCNLESSAKINPDTDVAIAFNEPDLLRYVPQAAVRACAQQLNDFGYAGAGYKDLVDLFVFPSETHRNFMVKDSGLEACNTAVLWNSINAEFYEGAEERRPNTIAYCSSPDRGLHWLLDYWPDVRKQVPDAQLRIYYRIDPWLENTRDTWAEIGFRARYVSECIRRLGRNGENGITVVGPTPNKEMARELMRAQALIYPCDTVRFTEGFSVSIMDACAAGAPPVITDIDAIGEVYRDAATIIPGRPQSRDPRWIEAIVRAMRDDAWRDAARAKALAFTQQNSRQIRAEQWEQLLLSQPKLAAQAA